MLLLDKATTAPPAGAGALSVTVPVDELPPSTEVGLTVTDATVREMKLTPDTLAPLTVDL